MGSGGTGGGGTAARAGGGSGASDDVLPTVGRVSPKLPTGTNGGGSVAVPRTIVRSGLRAAGAVICGGSARQPAARCCPRVHRRCGQRGPTGTLNVGA